MVKKDSILKYMFLIAFLILLIPVSLFLIVNYPFSDISNHEIISFFNVLFTASFPIISLSYQLKKTTDNTARGDNIFEYNIIFNIN
jgi:hypothetical protein